MEFLIAIFGLGVGVTLIVAKGILNAQDFAKAELDRKPGTEVSVKRGE